MHRPRIAALGLSLSLIAGCGGDKDSSGPSGGTMTGPTVTLELTVGDALLLDGISGLDVCVAETTHCAETDDAGLAVLTVPADADVDITIVGGGYVNTLLPYRTTSDDLVISIYLAPQASYDLLFEDLAPDPAKGAITVTLTESPGYTATVASGEEVHYWNDLSTGLDPSLTSTSNSGRFVAVNLSGDTATVTLDGPGTCTSRARYASAGPNKLVLPLLPGFYTGTTMDCE